MFTSVLKIDSLATMQYLLREQEEGLQAVFWFSNFNKRIWDAFTQKQNIYNKIK